MDELQIFENPEFGTIRSVEIESEPWLVGKDVAEALGYSNPRDALAKHVDDEDKNTVALRDGTSGNPNLTVINESGLYSLILSSKLPGAKKFKRWVTSEVLPAIRRTGGYMAPAKTLEDLTAAVQLLSEQVEEMLTREEERTSLLALPAGGSSQAPGIAAKRRWMRTVSEKLDLLSAKLNRPHNQILSRVYQILEREMSVSLDEERMKAIETYNLGECSILTAIFYSEKLKLDLQEIIDFNLAPENRGW
jgi:prophage antirepressor-like protein